MEHIIRTEDLQKIYNSVDVGVHALKGVSLDVTSGEFIAIMGPSGSGKSTLFNILGCLDRPTEGRYWLEGKDISLLTEAEIADVRNRKVGFVFQNFNLLPKAKAIENVELPLVFSKDRYSRKHSRELAKLALNKVGLGDRENHYPAQLSGGEQQRVAIARAIVTDPLIILADEPTGNLDTEASKSIMKILHDINQNGKTILIITHELEVAEYSRRILNFKDGSILSDRCMKGFNRNTGVAEIGRRH